MICPHCQREINNRTSKQNSSLHLFFVMLANELNEAGYDVKYVIKTGTSWTATLVKENIWRPLQKHLLNKKSTTQLNTKEIDMLYDELNRILAEKFKIHVPFPSIETMFSEATNEQN